MDFDNMRTSRNSRKKVTTAVVLLVVFLIVWQIGSMFGRAAGSSTTPGASVAVAQDATPASAPPPPPPKTATVAPIIPMTDREAALVTMQQETQVRYLQAVNELQLLKVARDIAMTNKDISSANLDRVTSDKKVIDLLSEPFIPSGNVTTVKTTQTTGAASPPPPPPGGIEGSGLSEANYTVLSISQVQYRWGAVLSLRGALLNVHVGDVLPADGSMVVAISKDSVTLQKNGVRKKISMVAVI